MAADLGVWDERRQLKWLSSHRRTSMILGGLAIYCTQSGRVFVVPKPINSSKTCGLYLMCICFETYHFRLISTPRISYNTAYHFHVSRISTAEIPL